MIIFVVIIYMSYPFGGISNMPVERCTVNSPKDAAIKLWEYREYQSGDIEHKSFEGKLYKIDLSKKTIEEVEIPKISFIKKKSK